MMHTFYIVGIYSSKLKSNVHFSVCVNSLRVQSIYYFPLYFHTYVPLSFKLMCFLCMIPYCSEIHGNCCICWLFTLLNIRNQKCASFLTPWTLIAVSHFL